MRTIIHKEHIQESLRRFLSDDRVVALNKEIQKIYEMDIPSYVVEQRHLKVIHDQRTELVAQKIHEMMHDIMIRDYPELIKIEPVLYYIC